MAPAKQPSCIGEFIPCSYLVLACFLGFCFNFNVYFRFILGFKLEKL